MLKNILLGFSLLTATLFFSLVSAEDEIATGPGQSTLKLHVFDCGMIRFDDIDFFSIANDETDIRDLSAPCYVVEHEKGRFE